MITLTLPGHKTIYINEVIKLLAKPILGCSNGRSPAMITAQNEPLTTSKSVNAIDQQPWLIQTLTTPVSWKLLEDFKNRV